MHESRVPISVLVPVKNEAGNLGRCLEALAGWADEVVVVDSQSTDGTADIASSHGATVLQFHYRGGWPKKRNWALDTFPFRNEWVLLLDADEILTDPVKREITQVVAASELDGYWVRFEIVFLGRQLRHGDTRLWKLSLFRKGKGRYEQRLQDQDASMADMEIHEHVHVDGSVGWLKEPVRHENVNALDRYIAKHNEYSNWAARVALEGTDGSIRPSLFGTQAARRRWLKRLFLHVPGSPLLLFLYFYVLRLGFLDGLPGLIYAGFKGVQLFHTKAKMYELRLAAKARPAALPLQPGSDAPQAHATPGVPL